MQHLARSVSVLLCVLLLVSVGLFGQAESGTVSGTITKHRGRRDCHHDIRKYRPDSQHSYWFRR